MRFALGLSALVSLTSDLAGRGRQPGMGVAGTSGDRVQTADDVAVKKP